MSRFAVFLLLLYPAAVFALLLEPSGATSQPSGNQSPPSASPALPQSSTNASPSAPGNESPSGPTTGVDPAAAIFPKAATAGVMLVTVKADRTSDYEEVIRALQQTLSQSTDERQQAIAKGWRVFKATTDPKANAIYVHLFEPVVPQIDYRPSLLLDEILGGAPADLLLEYRDAIAGAPSMLGMNEFARMSMPPAKPANTSPSGPTPPKPPGW